MCFSGAKGSSVVLCEILFPRTYCSHIPDCIHVTVLDNAFLLAFSSYYRVSLIKVYTLLFLSSIVLCGDTMLNCVQLSFQAADQQLYNLQKECEEKDATIKELAAAAHASSTSDAKVRISLLVTANISGNILLEY